MAPRPLSHTAMAIIRKTGANAINPINESAISIDRFRKPGAPETDLCRLELLSGADSSFHPVRDEVSNLRFEIFTRELLHLLAYLFHGPRHGLQSKYGARDVVRVLFRE